MPKKAKKARKQSRRCNHPGCGKGTIYGYDKCCRHGGGDRCDHPGCDKGAQGGSGKCIAHGGGKRCLYCVDWIDSRLASSYFDGYCGTCFRHVFPNDPRSAHEHRARSHEECVRLALVEAGYKDFVHDQVMWTGNCNCLHRRRVDFRHNIRFNPDNTRTLNLNFGLLLLFCCTKRSVFQRFQFSIWVSDIKMLFLCDTSFYICW